MSQKSILPEGEDLRKAVKWIIEQGSFSAKYIEQASLRFDLSPADESFLLRHFTQMQDKV